MCVCVYVYVCVCVCSMCSVCCMHAACMCVCVYLCESSLIFSTSCGLVVVVSTSIDALRHQLIRNDLVLNLLR